MGAASDGLGVVAPFLIMLAVLSHRDGYRAQPELEYDAHGMADIFFSYAPEERRPCRPHRPAAGEWRLDSLLRDANIKASAEWRRVLRVRTGQRRRRNRALVSRLGRKRLVTEEAERGRSRLISVRIDDVPIPLGFSQLQAVDLGNWRGGHDAEVDRLIAAVSETLKAPPPRPPVPPAPQRRKWYAAAAVALCLADAAAYPLNRWLTAPPPIMNQEIVLDSSAGMAATFDNGPTKLAAAVDALRVRNLHPKRIWRCAISAGSAAKTMVAAYWSRSAPAGAIAF